MAHPDDEDAAVLTLLARGKGAQVTLLSLTRGESGANLITGDFFERLGALRSLEHLKAAEYYGVAVRYTRATDFGYSKSVEETWRNWNRKQVLADVVAVIRQVRPQVVLCRWQGNLRDGHGHHTAAGEITPEAVRAAADPGFAPELGPAWRVSKLYSDNWRESDPGVLKVDSGTFDPVTGRSYAEIGREGYRWQRSQAMGAVIARPGPVFSYYKRVDALGGDESSLTDGLDGAAAPPAGLAEIAKEALAAFDARRPESSAPILARGLAAVREMPAGADREEWMRKFQKALNAALSLELEALVAPESPVSGMAAQFRPATTIRTATPGRPFGVTGALHIRGTENVEDVRLELAGATDVFQAEQTAPGEFRVSLLALPPEGAPPFRLVAKYRYRGVEGMIEKVPETRSIDSIGLEKRALLACGPALGVKFPSSARLLPMGNAGFETEVTVRSQGGGTKQGSLKLELPAGWSAQPAEVPFLLGREDEEARARFRVLPGAAKPGEYAIRAVAQSGGREYSQEFERITYPGLGETFLSAPARQVVAVLDAKVAPGLRAAYVMGPGDEVPSALGDLGISVDLLSPQDVAAADLKKYNLILTGIRAWAARDDLRVHNSRLLEYVNAGGVLIVQYNTPEYDKNYGPYPYSMTARTEETSEETAPVKMLDPANPVWSWPNKITAADWNGWVEQRGSKFFTTWDTSWRPMIETHDTGQAPQKGVWLQARYGNGLYVYCALAWYRQLPFAVPGAARIFANLVSQGSADAPWRK